jgi:SAM-dependent methyltransferase
MPGIKDVEKAKKRKKGGKQKKTKRDARVHITARDADRHMLYEKAVQCPEADVEFFDRVYTETYGKVATVLREDFCGTAAMCCEWLGEREENRAVGIDLDPEVLEWSRAHRVPELGEDARRLKLIEGDVLNPGEVEPAHIIAAFNFSYFGFHDRATLLAYFKSVKVGLAPEGLFILDIMGGPDAQVIQEEDREIDDEGFTYVWEQASFNPVTNGLVCYIHFHFPDGSKIRKAYTYDWRLWSVSELRDIAMEAGFSGLEVYWEGTDEDGEGDGNFDVSETGEDCEAWIAYVVVKP